jgi:hypothetical protein
MERRSIYDARIYWKIDRNWYRMVQLTKLSRAKYERYGLEVQREYEMRNERSLHPMTITMSEHKNANAIDIVGVLTYFFFFGARKEEYGRGEKMFTSVYGRGCTGINCVDDFSLETG